MVVYWTLVLLLVMGGEIRLEASGNITTVLFCLTIRLPLPVALVVVISPHEHRWGNQH
jgi:hypothetical protein